MQVALAHDYLTQRGGAERVALAMTSTFPGSPLYTSVHFPHGTFPEFDGVDVRTSFLQQVPLLRRDPRPALPLLALAWSTTRLRDADVVIASSSGWAHGVVAGEGTAKIIYCHNPARWLYQPEDYRPGPYQRAGLTAVRPWLLRWDQRAASTADVYLANSRVVAERIERVYGIKAQVLHPPVMIDANGEQEPVPGLSEGFWLTVARGRGYKNVEAVIGGVRRLSEGQLAVVGTPPPGQHSDGRVRWLGVVTDAELRWLYAHARALVSVSREDFGLTPLEANAFGTPAAVLQAGGFLDSLAEGKSGSWVEQPTAGAVHATLRLFPDFDPDSVRRHARAFDLAAFGHSLRAIATAAVARHQQRPSGDVSACDPAHSVGLPGDADSDQGAVVDVRQKHLHSSWRRAS